MSKLPQAHRFLDLSDYGRPIASKIAQLFKNTPVTAIHITLAFVVAGLAAFYCIINGYYWWAGFFLILKSILDAADGELARLKQNPSYTGRYLDSVSDIILNALFLLAIGYISKAPLWLGVTAFLGLQLQGTLYNYYYVILRNKFNGDTTSRIFEHQTPVALKGEKQKHVTLLFGLYKTLYGAFDKTIYRLDAKANNGAIFPNWFMTAVSTFGLGFQLLVMATFLALGLAIYILPLFALATVFVLVFIGLRKLLFSSEKRFKAPPVL